MKPKSKNLIFEKKKSTLKKGIRPYVNKYYEYCLKAVHCGFAFFHLSEI